MDHPLTPEPDPPTSAAEGAHRRQGPADLRAGRRADTRVDGEVRGAGGEPFDRQFLDHPARGQHHTQEGPGIGGGLKVTPPPVTVAQVRPSPVGG
ncbi:hypothetical protein OG339_18060 [Streptosporangium sp. NBC_01495]|uniref:hypothetical protein n=1 Tax=Streptosporangium sp. NBC_01495 TaxID=2903899 RepID=UPI002E32F313|nr:hypothetical protein [Streptosporangium sp. NBC_01495]